MITRAGPSAAPRTPHTATASSTESRGTALTSTPAHPTTPDPDGPALPQVNATTPATRPSRAAERDAPRQQPPGSRTPQAGLGHRAPSLEIGRLRRLRQVGARTAWALSQLVACVAVDGRSRPGSNLAIVINGFHCVDFWTVPASCACLQLHRLPIGSNCLGGRRGNNVSGLSGSWQCQIYSPQMR